jgi:hypothetical protein
MIAPSKINTSVMLKISHIKVIITNQTTNTHPFTNTKRKLFEKCT